jgi:GNAT superfamily N-acetyltransferase
MSLVISLADQIEEAEVVSLYQSNVWSSAGKPVELMAALRNSHGLVTARIEGKLVGLGNAISDGSLVVYFPHLLVHPEYHRRGIGRRMFEALLTRYSGFHQLMITADARAVGFYEAMGFSRAGNSVPMWIYGGTEH